MRTGAVNANALPEDGARLTASYHLPPDLAAAVALQSSVGKAVPLQSLCLPGGIYRGPIFKRIPANGPSYGRPYVAPAELERLEIGSYRYLSFSHGRLLDDLALTAGMICVTCSGMSLGKVIFVRPDMEGLVASHDLIRILPDREHVHPGYLFAFLSSRLGKLAIRRQIYGSSIRHIEPQHLFELPIVRLGTDAEAAIGQPVLEAQKAIASGLSAVAEARRRLHKSVGLEIEGLLASDEVRADELIGRATKLRSDAAKAIGDVASEFDSQVAAIERGRR